MSQTNTVLREKRRARLRGSLGGWAIMLPGVILFAFFIWVPLAQALRLSFYEANGTTVKSWVGLGNFRSILRGPDFWPAFRNTFVYLFWSLVIGFFIPMALAVLIQECFRGKALFRTAVYLPNIVPGLATVFLFRYIFKSDAYGGLNMLRSLVGLPAVGYLNSAAKVIPMIVLAMTWKGAGSTTLIYLAGIQGINPELYEAAIIDGANIKQRVFHVTLPQIFNLARTLLILQVISVFQVLYEPLVMTNGGPNNASISLMQLVYRYAFDYFDYAKASAVSVIVGAILIALTLIYNRVVKKQDA